MVPFIAALIGGLANAASSIVGRVLIAMGFSFMTFTGIDVALAALKAQSFAAFAGLPAQAFAVMGALQVDRVSNIIFSALAARLFLNGLTSGSITRMVLK